MSNTKEKNKLQHGGHREGAGRPRGTGTKIKISVSVDANNWHDARKSSKETASGLIDNLVADYVSLEAENIQKPMKTNEKQLQLRSPEFLDLQLKDQRRTVDFDTFDIQLQELLRMLQDGEIWVAPAYQRKFRWKEDRCSQLIESLLLGIPVPSLMMATNQDNTWEVVDGVQRLSSIAKFMGNDDLRAKLKVGDSLKLETLRKLTDFDGFGYSDLPPHIQLHFRTRPLKVITLNDKSDKIVRYDLFERLNTGGVALSPQEIRDCIYQGNFASKLEELAAVDDFKTFIKLTPLQQRDGTAEECVLRFFAYYHRYKQFEHLVTQFLNTFMEDANKNFDYPANEKLFKATFSQLVKAFPHGLSRTESRRITPLNLFEAVSVGAALALQKRDSLVIRNVNQWIGHPELKRFTSGATNNPKAVKGRIEFCRDRFLGEPYVESTKN
jgi:hypothetical protein